MTVRHTASSAHVGSRPNPRHGRRHDRHQVRARYAHPPARRGRPGPRRPHPKISFYPVRPCDRSREGRVPPAPLFARPIREPRPLTARQPFIDQPQGYHPRLRQARGYGSPRRARCSRRLHRPSQRPRGNLPQRLRLAVLLHRRPRVMLPRGPRDDVHRLALELLQRRRLHPHRRAVRSPAGRAQLARIGLPDPPQVRGTVRGGCHLVRARRSQGHRPGVRRAQAQGTVRRQARRRHRAPPLHQRTAAPRARAV